MDKRRSHQKARRTSIVGDIIENASEFKKTFNHRVGENVPQLWNANRNFLELYQPYIKTEWRFHYFSYDTMKAKYKALKEQTDPDLRAFERDFYDEIQRVDWFLNTILHEIQRDLKTISDTCAFLHSNTQEDNKKKEELGRTVEVFIRSIFEKCKACERFYKLNHYVICKIAKKFEKLIESGSKNKHRDDFMPWRDYPSNDLFNRKFTGRIDEIHSLTRKSVDTYSEKFRKTYPSLAYGELEFVKNKERESVRTRFYIGVKLGLIVATLAWLISDSYVTPNNLRFWQQPGLYVYTTVGNLLLFRFCWGVNIFLWSRYDVNYLSVFQLTDIKPNLLLVINQTATQFVLYCINLMVFFRANCYGSGIYNTFLSYGCPSILIIMAVCYEYYEYHYFSKDRLSRGMFTKQVVFDLVMAPFAKVTFRDVYSADTMTSFTKVISDFIYAGCWVISGSFLLEGQTSTNFGSEYLSCTNRHMHVFIGVMQLYPQYIRIMQCARNYYKTGLTVHLRNILKYFTTVIVIVFGMVYTGYNTQYLVMVIISTLYKWYWDIAMDWGLLEILPTVDGGLSQFNCCCPNGTSNLTTRRINAAAAAAGKGKKTDKKDGKKDKKDKLKANDDDDEEGGDIEASRSMDSSVESSAKGPTVSNTSAASSSFGGSSRKDQQAPARAAPPARPTGQGMFLRKHLMYPSYTVYYICAVVDLILRFLWVVSLLPAGFLGDFVGPQLSFCLASLEIVRRAMWGTLRVEWEHLKFAQKGTVGFLQRRSTTGAMRSIPEFDSEEDVEGDAAPASGVGGGTRVKTTAGSRPGSAAKSKIDDDDDTATGVEAAIVAIFGGGGGGGLSRQSSHKPSKSAAGNKKSNKVYPTSAAADGDGDNDAKDSPQPHNINNNSANINNSSSVSVGGAGGHSLSFSNSHSHSMDVAELEAAAEELDTVFAYITANENRGTLPSDEDEEDDGGGVEGKSSFSPEIMEFDDVDEDFHILEALGATTGATAGKSSRGNSSGDVDRVDL